MPQNDLKILLQFFVTSSAERYWNDRAVPAAPRSETRHQLRMMAHLAWLIAADSARLTVHEAQLRRLLISCNRTALTLVCDGVREVTGTEKAAIYVHFHRYATTAPTILQAALIAERKLKGGGDYGNDPLKIALAILVFVFDTATGGLPAFSRAPIGPVGNGSQRTIARSPCAPFIFAFFRYVDPALSEAQISNVLEARLALNRHQQKVDPPYFKVLPNLL